MYFPEKDNKENQLYIVKRDNNFSLSIPWALEDVGNYDFNNKIEDRAFSHGGDIVGDGTVKGHSIKIRFQVCGETEVEHDELLNEVYEAFCQHNYKLFCGRKDRYYRVSGVSKITQEYLKGWKQLCSNVSINLLLADPFRYSTHSSSNNFSYEVKAAHEKMVVINEGNVPTPIIFKLRPEEKMDFIVIEQYETERKFELKDALLIKGRQAQINAISGTVWRDKENSINAFSGQFLFAVPGKNTFFYTGNPGKIDIVFRPRWFL